VSGEQAPLSAGPAREQAVDTLVAFAWVNAESDAEYVGMLDALRMLGVTDDEITEATPDGS
jgi:uncharacterized protein YjgD (DUF1641 family)